MIYELTIYSSKKLVTSIQNRVSRIEYPESSIEYRVSSIEHRVSSIERRATGFTLLEVMVAMAIMAIVLVSVYRMHAQTLTMNTANRFYTQAPMLAQGKLAQLATGSSEIIAGDSGDLGEKFPGYSWSVAVEEVSSEALGEVADDLKRIDLTVSYNEYVYSVRTYRLMRE
jgi:general secretion pathway protein I